jgi:tripartite ATP-independent transporter DctM subunit
MIIYAVLAEESVLWLFTAGWIPGFLLAGCFMAWIMIDTARHPELVPESERALKHMPFSARLAALKELGPSLFLIVCVIGSMYAGVATPTEAAALGVLGAFLVSSTQGSLNWASLRDVAIGSVQTCSMMGLIILGASILGNITAAWASGRGGEDGVRLAPVAADADRRADAALLVARHGARNFSMIATTLPVVLPLVTAAGFNKVWFGVFMVIVVEMAQITPPVAFNLRRCRA